MSLLTTRTVSLSVALLLASTSLSQAGFVWLSPDKPNNDNTVFSQQAEPAAPVENVQGRTWNVDPAVPVAGSQPVSPVVPMQLSDATAPAPVVVPVVTPVEQPVTLVGGNTISSQPVYAPGDQAPAPVASASAPVVSQQAPVEMIAAAPVSAPAAEQEVVLASTRNSNMPLPTPVAQPGNAASAAMPSAEAMISGMPSMTAPRTTTTSVAPVVAPAPVAVTETPVQAPVELAAPASSPVVPMLSPATVPMQSAAVTQQPVAPVTAPAVNNSTVSMVTGQAVTTAGSVPAPVANTGVANTSKVIDGFGKHVPLVIAMRQILPSGYGFAHGSGVDLTTAIDWQGGRPWPQVLAEAISPIGLTASVMGDTVMIEKLGNVAPAQNAPMQLSSVEAPAVVPSSAPLAAGQAVLTNATVMQTPPSNN